MAYHQPLAATNFSTQALTPKIPKKPKGGGVQQQVAAGTKRTYEPSHPQSNGFDICLSYTAGKCSQVNASGAAGPLLLPYRHTQSRF